MGKLTSAIAVALCLVAATPAHAATVAQNGDAVDYRAGAGESNFVLMDIARNRLHFGDAVRTLRAGRGCTRRQPLDSSPEAYCSASVSRATISLGDRHDFAALLLLRRSPSVTVSGGSGGDVVVYFLDERPVRISLDGVANDGPAGRTDDIKPDVETILGTNASGDVLEGSAGPNSLDPGPGRDRVSAGAGNDVVSTRDSSHCSDDRRCRRAARDVVSCGDGSDIADGDRLDLLAADCEVVVRDHVARLTDGPDRFTGFREKLKVFGRGGDDRLTGGGSDTLVGGPGDDVLRAAYVRNRLRGGPGRDTVYGAFGRDRMAGGPGDDRLLAGTGNDYVYGGSGRDVVRAGTGADAIFVRDGASDRVRCGAGNDRVVADPGDVVSRGCERVRRAR